MTLNSSGLTQWTLISTFAEKRRWTVLGLTQWTLTSTFGEIRRWTVLV